MSERCGYAVTDSEGIEGPCDRPVTGWRWYQDCGHEDMLEAACSWHENEGGRLIHNLTARLARVEALANEWADEGIGLGASALLADLAQDLRAALASGTTDAHTTQTGGAGS